MILTEDQMKSLRERQKANSLHPYTCICGFGILSVSKDGLYCEKCGYTQDWAHSVDLNWGWKDLLSFPDVFR